MLSLKKLKAILNTYEKHRGITLLAYPQIDALWVFVDQHSLEGENAAPISPDDIYHIIELFFQYPVRESTAAFQVLLDLLQLMHAPETRLENETTDSPHPTSAYEMEDLQPMSQKQAASSTSTSEDSE